MMYNILLCVSVLCTAKSNILDDHDITREKDRNVSLEDKLAVSLNEFGFKLLKQLMTSGGNTTNVAISPAGISGLLAMTLLGSVGDSYDEIAQALGFSNDIKINSQYHDQFGELLNALNSDSVSSKTMYADAVFADTGAKLRDAYRMYLQRVYQSDAMGLNFKDKQHAKNTLNDWVKNHTQGKIENFLKDSLPTDTKVVLLSALYFSGQWKHPFLIDYTTKIPFETPTGPILVDQMLNLGTFPYLSSLTDELHMIALPYNDSTTTMYALMPRRPKHLSLPDLLHNLTYSKINNLIGRMTERKCVLRYPKMDLHKVENIEDSLKALGVTSIFLPNKANFALMIDSDVNNKTEHEIVTRIASGDVEEKTLRELVNSLPNPGVHVDTVLHDVKIKIDEFGTEAVAATTGILARSADLFYADSPFLMFIRNEKTKLITFSAVVLDPTS